MLGDDVEFGIQARNVWLSVLCCVKLCNCIYTYTCTCNLSLAINNTTYSTRLKSYSIEDYPSHKSFFDWVVPALTSCFSTLTYKFSCFMLLHYSLLTCRWSGLNFSFISSPNIFYIVIKISCSSFFLMFLWLHTCDLLTRIPNKALGMVNGLCFRFKVCSYSFCTIRCYQTNLIHFPSRVKKLQYMWKNFLRVLWSLKTWAVWDIRELWIGPWVNQLQNGKMIHCMEK